MNIDRPRNFFIKAGIDDRGVAIAYGLLSALESEDTAVGQKINVEMVVPQDCFHSFDRFY